MGSVFLSRVYSTQFIRFHTAIYMVIINSITVKFVQTVGGTDTIYGILSLMFVFMVVFVFYKIAT